MLALPSASSSRFPSGVFLLGGERWLIGERTRLTDFWRHLPRHDLRLTSSTSRPLRNESSKLATSPSERDLRNAVPHPHWRCPALRRLPEQVRFGRGIEPRPRRCTYCIEFSPRMLPSVSMHTATQPNCPMANLGRKTLPRAATTRSCSTAQSATLK